MLKTIKTWGLSHQFSTRSLKTGHGRKHLHPFAQKIRNFSNSTEEPEDTDVLIIGGGAMGSSTAYWLKNRKKNIKVTVIEKDSSYAMSSTCLSVGGVRQQFSLHENVQLSLFGSNFIRNISKYLSVADSDPIDINFQSHGYLFLASCKGVDIITENSKLQCSLGADNLLLSSSQLKEQFPWLNTDGVELGCFGRSMEGWFDPWSFLMAFKRKNLSLGTKYVQAEVVGFERLVGNEKPVLLAANFKHMDGSIKRIKFRTCVLAAGPNSGQVARMAGIGTGKGLMQAVLPIEPRKRYVYCFHCPDDRRPPDNTPLVVDPSGAYFRPEGRGGKFICGLSPEPADEPSSENLEVDYSFFEEEVWPILSNRVPAFENLKLQNAWAGFYELNTLDANGVIGQHPAIDNLYIASGFSGHGIQHSPAVGRAIMELIIDGKYQTIDLARLGFERLCRGQPLLETNIV